MFFQRRITSPITILIHSCLTGVLVSSKFLNLLVAHPLRHIIRLPLLEAESKALIYQKTSVTLNN